MMFFTLFDNFFVFRKWMSLVYTWFSWEWNTQTIHSESWYNIERIVNFWQTTYNISIFQFRTFPNTKRWAEIVKPLSRKYLYGQKTKFSQLHYIWGTYLILIYYRTIFWGSSQRVNIFVTTTASSRDNSNYLGILKKWIRGYVKSTMYFLIVAVKFGGYQ